MIGTIFLVWFAYALGFCGAAAVLDDSGDPEEVGMGKAFAAVLWPIGVPLYLVGRAWDGAVVRMLPPGDIP